MDGFKIVTRKRGKKKQFATTVNCKETYFVSGDNHIASTVKRKALSAKETLCCTDFYTEMKGKVEECTKKVNGPDKSLGEIVTYGLGNFAECLISRYQLALLLALREDLQIPPSDVLLYDPKFFMAEKEVLSDFGFHVLSENEEGKRQCGSSTLFYMPHCGKSLYNNLLFANWSPDRLHHVIIIGNSFTNMVQNVPSSTMKKCAPLIMKIQPYAEEILLPGNFQYEDVFNDTVIHLFPQGKLNLLDTEFWEHCPEPKYDQEDLEFIPKS
ncbi:SRR1-like protein [Saccostrea echinata]|uniref:SRR1-like protein n=1 Tax=Saccostrea echinata TaxID=191078 RepID=UPI002A8053B3|nr:SRR1-like protein [Saccostrea echinata]